MPPALDEPTTHCLVAIDHDAAQLGETLAQNLPEAARCGFEGLVWQQERSLFDSAGPVPDFVLEQCRRSGLSPIVELDLTLFPLDHPLVERHPALFGIRRWGAGDAPIDPRKQRSAVGLARARLQQPDAAILLDPFVDAAMELVDAGVRGFRLCGIDRIRPDFLFRFLTALRKRASGLLIFADASNMPRSEILARAELGFDFIVSSFGWWDLRASWLVEEVEALRRAVPIVAEVRPPQVRSDNPAEIGRSMMAAASTGTGFIAPLGAVHLCSEAATRAVDIASTARHYPGEMRRLSGSSSPVTALLRAEAGDVRKADTAMLTLINTSPEPSPAPEPQALLPGMGADFAFDESLFRPLHGCEVRIAEARTRAPIVLAADEDAQSAAVQPRLVIEAVSPAVTGGDFPVKRVVGESVDVSAKIFGDGHEQLAAEIQWRGCDEDEWAAARMVQFPNDLWEGHFPLRRMGRHEFRIEAWLDRFGAFRRDFRKKLDAGVAQKVDYAEGRVLVEKASARTSGDLAKALALWAGKLKGDDKAEALLSDDLAALMDQADDRPHQLHSDIQLVDAERLQARYSSWYELFPRSQTNDPKRHGTFLDVIERLPAIREMGFDTLYFPPIHPIGRTNRKGPNNTLTPGEGDPGSPYAIGSADGGHDALHPELGSLADFERLIEAAHEHGLEIALDFAIQCSPDHPWLKDHPDWFDWRPDGTVKYAENPPKKYQDIVNVDFYQTGAIPDLWLALRDVVLFWVERGVKTFRVDNPHTKPLPFWEWMIANVRARHPDAIFLAEAFTRPGMMYRLAKIGFSQSYTYFTWRDHKGELIDYITELTQTGPKEFYRPHFFVNTPDINPHFLQTSGRPGFRIRAVLAATLSGLFGVYSGFELCEAAPVPGKEEYLDSEKYEIRPRDFAAPGNIVGDITLLNRLRRSHPALQTHLNTRFLHISDDAVLYYAKPSPDGSDMLLVMVSLDPHNSRSGHFEVPLWDFGIDDNGSIGVEDLTMGGRFRWYGKWQHITLDPDQPYRIWRVAPGADA
ncbi:MAG: alpha-1,4-glucan--maltose-1-phosphate maltosyltransferase [Novosphingobium sp.]|nr:alpha-1,4-glucan--maltose-1-phosphate maltosyltransferase [Novosphingobium sp.]